jgi:hypothetical protein
VGETYEELLQLDEAVTKRKGIDCRTRLHLSRTASLAERYPAPAAVMAAAAAAVMAAAAAAASAAASAATSLMAGFLHYATRQDGSASKPSLGGPVAWSGQSATFAWRCLARLRNMCGACNCAWLRLCQSPFAHLPCSLSNLLHVSADFDGGATHKTAVQERTSNGHSLRNSRIAPLLSFVRVNPVACSHHGSVDTLSTLIAS